MAVIPLWVIIAMLTTIEIFLLPSCDCNIYFKAVELLRTFDYCSMSANLFGYR